MPTAEMNTVRGLSCPLFEESLDLQHEGSGSFTGWGEFGHLPYPAPAADMTSSLINSDASFSASGTASFQA